MALTGAQYQSMRTKFLGLLGSPYQGVSSAELDSFLGQLNIDILGASAVTPTQTANANTMLAGYLSSPSFTASASNISEFVLAAIAALPSVVTALTGPRYLQLKQQFTGVLSYAGIRTEAQMLGYLSAFIFSGNFSSLFSGTQLFAIQSDRGVSQSGGIVTGVTDQAQSIAFASNSAGQRPLVGVGYNGHASITFDGVDDELNAAVVFPNPSVTPYYCYSVFKPTSKGAQVNYHGGANSGGGVLYSPTGNVSSLQQSCGSGGNASSMTSALTRLYAEFTGTTADRLKSGANSFVTGVSSGTASDTAAVIGAATIPGVFAAQMDLVLVVYGTGVLSASLLSAIDAQASSYWGGVLV